MPIQGTIFEIQRFCIHDGPGIRTTIFLKGCPLHCLWCHNPEGILKNNQLSFLEDSCINCGKCIQTCLNNVHQIIDGKHFIDRTLCSLCGKCAMTCPVNALEIVGHKISIQDVLDEVLRDKTFYETSEGGVTISGGEPMYQIDFIDNLLVEFRKNGLHSAIQTCGYTSWKNYKRILPKVDMIIFDIKETDPKRHLEYTTVDNSIILSNLHQLHDAGSKILIRLPIIPSFNDREDHFEAVANLVNNLPNLFGIEIVPYHRLGLSKFQRLGLEEPSENILKINAPNKELVNKWKQTLIKYGVNKLI